MTVAKRQIRAFPWKRWLATGLCFAVAVAVVGQSGESGGGMVRAGAARRDREAAVLFERMSGSVLDVADRVDFRLTSEGIQLYDAAFRRRPQVLTDGVSLVQTPDSEQNTYVRQVLEHPLADRTVVVFPGDSAGVSLAASRLVAMAELVGLNTARSLRIACAGADGSVRTYAPVIPAEPFSEDRVERAWSSGASAATLLATWAGLVEDGFLAGRVHAAPGAVSGPAQGAAVTRAPEAVAAREAVLSMLQAREPTMMALLDGQGLLVIEQIERAIRRAFAELPNDGRAEISTLNELQNRLAEIVGGSGPRALVFEPDSSELLEARAVLRDIDALIGSDTESMFLRGIEGIRKLFLHDLPEDLGRLAPAAKPDATEPETPEPPVDPLGAQNDFLRAWVNRLPAGALGIAEVRAETVYALVQWSLESSGFNLVIMAGAPPGDAGGGDLTAGGRTDAEALPSYDVTAHPEVEAIISAASGPGGLDPFVESYRRWFLLEQVRLALAADAMDRERAVVLQRAIGDHATLVGMATRSGSPEPRFRFFILPGTDPRTFPAAVEALVAATSPDALTASVLRRWAIVAQTAVDL